MMLAEQATGPAEVRPLVVQAPVLALRAVPSRTLATSKLGHLDPLRDLAVVASGRATDGARHLGVPDGNRSAIGAIDVSAWGRVYRLGFKGVGAGAPLFGDGPLEGPLDDVDGSLVLRPIVRESWMGESPFGAQGEANARAAIARTDEAERGLLFGMPICPVLSAVEIPEALVEREHHYRRWDGAVVQEHRLVPSDVRLFHGSGPGLGQAPARFVHELDLEGATLAGFVERLLGSGLAALTVHARSLRTAAGGLEGIDFDDAWLDKDTLVGRDGTLFFVDLESLDWVGSRDEAQATARIRRQLERNAYDLLFVADALLRAAEPQLSDAARSRRIATLARLALEASPGVVGVDESAQGVHLIVAPPALGREIPLRFLDARR